MTISRTFGRMRTAYKTVFRRLLDGTFLEIRLHLTQFLHDDGTLKSERLEKEEERGIWKLGKEGERSLIGETLHKFPDQEKPVRLVCIKRGP